MYYTYTYTYIWRRQWHPTPVLLPGKSHGRRSLVGCSPWGRWGSDMTEWLHFHSSLSCIGEGNGNPLQYSCLENPRDGGAWWAAVYGVAQSQTWLKRLSSSNSSIYIYIYVRSKQEVYLGTQFSRTVNWILSTHPFPIFHFSYFLLYKKIANVNREKLKYQLIFIWHFHMCIFMWHWGLNNGPKYVYILISRVCDYVTLHGKRDFTDVN